MPWLSKLYKVETHVRVSTAFWEGKKNQNVIVLQHLSFSSPYLGNTDRISSIRKIFDTGFEKLSKSGIHLISSHCDLAVKRQV